MARVGPNVVVIAHDAIDTLPDIVREHGRAIFVTDRVIFSRYRDRLKEVMGADPNWLTVEDFSSRNIPAESFDVIVGFGGGRSIDAAKLLAAETGHEWISVPTAASHDGIASEAASVSHNGYRYSKRCKLPIAVVADLTIMSMAPRHLQLAGTGDILCKASSLSEWKMAHEIGGEPFNGDAFGLVKQALESILESNDLETLVRAEIDAGKAMYLAGSSRPCSGTEHAISHAMERREHSLHGLQVIFATPLCLHYLEERGYAMYRTQQIIDVMEKRGLPRSLSDMSTDAETFLDDVHHALRIMEKRNRLSVLKDVSDSEILHTIRELY
ncbi:MAG: hypothetical protein DRO73_08205 [Candidatus Thorarchaeota archaeon]|nr:MAG: hypothetical protein DRO73_08205 [Candidatus Thorarchaeota archaeon]